MVIIRHDDVCDAFSTEQMRQESPLVRQRTRCKRVWSGGRVALAGRAFGGKLAVVRHRMDLASLQWTLRVPWVPVDSELRVTRRERCERSYCAATSVSPLSSCMVHGS